LNVRAQKRKVNRFGASTNDGNIRHWVCRRNFRSTERFLSDCRPFQAVKYQSHRFDLPVLHPNPLDAGYCANPGIRDEIIDDTSFLSVDEDSSDLISGDNDSKALERREIGFRAGDGRKTRA
jgi:hypothetical protein